jgi:4-aminobutyrate aminotransferase/(S)-3-amino-2-methylpropionate transaminase
LYDRFLGHRVNASTIPTNDFADLLRENVMPIAPPGMQQVHLSDGTMTQANESALTVALLQYAKTHNVADPSKLMVLGFDKGYYGSSFMTKSISYSGECQSLYNWPRAPFPKMKYPMAEFEHENREEEDRCLEEVRKIIKQRLDAK